MRRMIVIVVAVTLVVVLAAFTCTYSVRYTDTAVRTFFGSASEASVQRAPGLKFKLPYPAHTVFKYDTRTRFIQSRKETQTTADDKQIIVLAFCTWRVSDPLKFFQKFSNAGERSADHFAKAEDVLLGTLRGAVGATSRFRMVDLFAAGEAVSKLPELEAQILGALNSAGQAGETLADSGIEAIDAGIIRIELPQATTQAVFEAMGAERDRIASAITSQGDSLSESIRASGDSDARRILEFANLRASQIRTQGEKEAVEYIKQMDVNAELAMFLRNMEFFRESYSKRTTFVLSSSMPGIHLLFPDAMATLRPGEIPTLSEPGAKGASP